LNASLYTFFNQERLHQALDYQTPAQVKEYRLMRYMLLIYASEVDFSHMTSEERAAIMQGHSTFAQEAMQRGILTGGAPLQPTSTARTVRIRKGKTLVVDGPFAETKEQLAGTYILDCKNLDEAIELATKIPDALHGSIEIRTLMEV